MTAAMAALDSGSANASRHGQHRSIRILYLALASAAADEADSLCLESARSVDGARASPASNPYAASAIALQSRLSFLVGLSFDFLA